MKFAQKLIKWETKLFICMILWNKIVYLYDFCEKNSLESCPLNYGATLNGFMKNAVIYKKHIINIKSRLRNYKSIYNQSVWYIFNIFYLCIIYQVKFGDLEQMK